MSVKDLRQMRQMREMRELLSWLGKMPRNPRQTHGLNESDSEVIRLDARRYLAATVDAVSEEIALGLYRDPYTMGWVTAMASLSDLAAVGAKPLGLLLSSQWGAEFTERDKKRAARGFAAALHECDTYLLGGDSGGAARTILSSTGLGLCDSKPLSRVGLRPGDYLAVTGKLGIGPALGFRYLLGDDPALLPEKDYRPRARVDAGFALRGIASAAMDTSDGLATTLDTLRRINRVGMELWWDQQILNTKAAQYCRKRGFPLTSLWFGEHGDFQIVVGIPKNCLKRARARVPDIYVIGKVSYKFPDVKFRVQSGAHGDILREMKLDCVAARSKANLAELRSAFDDMIAYLKREGFP